VPFQSLERKEREKRKESIISYFGERYNYELVTEGLLMRLLHVTDVTKRFQTTVPKLVREILEITDKDRVVWISDNGEIKVRKA